MRSAAKTIACVLALVVAACGNQAPAEAPAPAAKEPAPAPEPKAEPAPAPEPKPEPAPKPEPTAAAAPEGVAPSATPPAEGPYRLPEDQVDAEQKAFAGKWATELLERQKAGTFEPLGDEVTPSVRAGLTPERQRTSHEQFQKLFGEFKEMTYAGTWRIVGEPHIIYRFRGAFAKEQPEVRVVFDEAGKISGLWLKPWMNQLN